MIAIYELQLYDKEFVSVKEVEYQSVDSLTDEIICNCKRMDLLRKRLGEECLQGACMCLGVLPEFCKLRIVDKDSGRVLFEDPEPIQRC